MCCKRYCKGSRYCKVLQTILQVRLKIEGSANQTKVLQYNASILCNTDWKVQIVQTDSKDCNTLQICHAILNTIVQSDAKVLKVLQGTYSKFAIFCLQIISAK